MINTGRSKAGIPKKLTRRIHWDGFVCAGAYAEFHGEVLGSQLMPKKSVEKIMEYVEKDKIPVIFDTVGPSYFLRCKGPNPIASVNEIYTDFEKKKVNKLEVLRMLSDDALADLSDYAACYPMGTYVDVFVHGCSKATGMKLIGEKTGIPRERMIAFGDNNNDREMLLYAGKSVAMKISSEGAVEAATYHATKHKQGVVQGIKKYLGI